MIIALLIEIKDASTHLVQNNKSHVSNVGPEREWHWVCELTGNDRIAPLGMLDHFRKQFF